MSSLTTLTTSTPQGKLPFFTTPTLRDYYMKQLDIKFQRKGKDTEVIDGHEVFYKPTSYMEMYNNNGPFVEVLTSVFDSLGNEIPKVYPYQIRYNVEKGYMRPPTREEKGPQFVAVPPESGEERLAMWPADDFCKVMERFEG